MKYRVTAAIATWLMASEGLMQAKALTVERPRAEAPAPENKAPARDQFLGRSPAPTGPVAVVTAKSPIDPEKPAKPQK